MNTNASSTTLAAAAIIAFAALLGTILTLALSPNPTGGELQSSVTVFGIAIAIALGSAVASPARTL